jgi:c-di-GMP-binding flagellar brake protein YcgR
MLDKSGGSERRRAARLVASFDVNIGFAGFDQTAKTINISSTGLLCQISKEIPVMTRLDMALILPTRVSGGESKAIKVKGVVVRNEKDGNDYRAAIFFLEMKPDDQRKLESFVRSKA